MIDASPALFYGLREDVMEVCLHEPAPPERVPEAFVHDLWEAQSFASGALVTSTGEALEVYHPGHRNSDAGPDFRSARLRIGDMTWIGDVEIHTTSGSWYTHRHHLDPRYNAVVLHVTLYPDVWTGGLIRQDGSMVDEVTLAPLLRAPVHRLLYQFRMRPERALPCAGAWPRVPSGLITPMIDRLAEDRLSSRTRDLATRYLHAPDLEALLYERLFRALGYARNDEAMATLTRHVPLSLLQTLTGVEDFEACLLGVAGLLSGAAPPEDPPAERAYRADLIRRFEVLQKLWGLPIMAPTQWQYFRLRPANFPPLRIVQGARLMHRLLSEGGVGMLVRALEAAEPIPRLREHLGVVPPPFWNTHTRLDRRCKPRTPRLGANRIDICLANAVLPVLLLHADLTEQPWLTRRIHSVLRDLPAPGDEVLRTFEGLGVHITSAFEAQGVHQLYRTQCREGRCLQCPVGRHILEGE